MLLMEKLQGVQGELENAKEEISQVSKFNLLGSRKGGESDPILEAALEETERVGVTSKAQKEIETLRNSHLMLDGAKL